MLSQRLLLRVLFEATPEEVETLAARFADLAAAGFEIEPMSGRSYAIAALPAEATDRDPAETLRMALASLADASGGRRGPAARQAGRERRVPVGRDDPLSPRSRGDPAPDRRLVQDPGPLHVPARPAGGPLDDARKSSRSTSSGAEPDERTKNGCAWIAGSSFTRSAATAVSLAWPAARLRRPGGSRAASTRRSSRQHAEAVRPAAGLDPAAVDRGREPGHDGRLRPYDPDAHGRRLPARRACPDRRAARRVRDARRRRAPDGRRLLHVRRQAGRSRRNGPRRRSTRRSSRSPSSERSSWAAAP